MDQVRVKTIHNDLLQLANEQIAEHSQRFFKTGKGEYGEGDIFLGIRVPVLRKLVKKYRGISIAEVRRLLHSKFHEERLLAVLMLVQLFKSGDESEQKLIYDLYLENTGFINNWDIVDISASNIVGAHLYEKDKAPLYDLVQSKTMWERRISIIATFYLIRQNEFDDTLKIAEILLNDEEDLIQKAVGWMLREVGKREIESEEEFLQEHYKKMPRTMLRYAIEKFPETSRKMYLRGEV
ncbi:MAG: DNA alkylation repair protein [SAR324 cluster bacterium]|nr:DNA alkylation repair protein [SAR324 cluster bacterium]